MQVTRLEIRDLRRLEPTTLLPAPGLNLITGPNGAGKTSLLEALHLLAYGRSFRGRVRDGLIRTGADAVEVFAEWTEHAGRGRKAGLRHGGQRWEGRLDGVPVAQLGELCAALAAVTFEPGSHALVSGGGEPRRRFVDWGLFHVEHDFFPLWRRYARALKQRNALLKTRHRDTAQLDVWDHELAEAGEPLGRRRQEYLEALQPGLQVLAADFVPSLGVATLAYQPGWRREELTLADALLLARERDAITGFTSVGPHRADWRVDYAERPGREALSRGQAKLTALACLLVQAQDFAERRGEWPVILLDDLGSELDQEHQSRVLRHLLAGQAQVFLTGTEPPTALDPRAVGAMFHVEHGLVEHS
ncbi:MAG: DNA replication/repair protein RecF [Pseudomonadota bacterium]|nr:DNA replication/repair protein RecF [Pseudomonadota bacterium]